MLNEKHNNNYSWGVGGKRKVFGISRKSLYSNCVNIYRNHHDHIYELICVDIPFGYYPGVLDVKFSYGCCKFKFLTCLNKFKLLTYFLNLNL